jgi:hypothetical protein
MGERTQGQRRQIKTKTRTRSRLRKTQHTKQERFIRKPGRITSHHQKIWCSGDNGFIFALSLNIFARTAKPFLKQTRAKT